MNNNPQNVFAFFMLIKVLKENFNKLLKYRKIQAYHKQ